MGGEQLGGIEAAAEQAFEHASMIVFIQHFVNDS